MNYNIANYVGKKIQLYPGDTDSKYGIIKNVDDLGWTIKITSSSSRSWVAGQEYFVSHSKNFTFEFRR